MQASSNKDSLADGMFKRGLAKAHSDRVSRRGGVPASPEKLLNVAVKLGGFIKKSTQARIFSLFLHGSHSRRFDKELGNCRSPDMQSIKARCCLVAFEQRHFRPIDRNHHARGVGVDFNWDAPQLIGLTEGIDDVELPKLFLRHLDQLGIGVVVCLPVPEERVANALVDSVYKGFISHGKII
ncbi:hypothetical protein GL58_20615 [Comamonas testosteroni]|uniref:Uncharacterized protein n=1 Tax=Comamonas testosteroni TaxID=285 RepID=A0A0L7MBT9_COMTE|nr:hypothetical protein GL58_20615 [Comamonas testosteroni]